MEEQFLTAYLCFWLAVLGAVLGSFLDCAASRWAAGDPHPFAGRSRCSSCGHALGTRDLVPVFSFLLRRGRCRYCGAGIPAGCLAAELAGAAVFACLGARFGWTPELGQWLIWAALLLALSLTDWAKRIIPDKLLLALAANRAVWFALLGHGAREALEAAKALAVPAALLALVLAMEKLLGREAMGGGDVKLLAVLALYLGWAELFLTLLAGCLLGLLWAALTGGKTGTAMPFGPFLAAGAVLTVCYGGPVLDWYFGLL
nr:prepilin peptidase [uncultured Oscillibacter sp.]